MRNRFWALTLLAGMAIINSSEAAQPDDHWFVGCWGIRSWGGVRAFPEGFCIDTDPEGYLNSIGYWQPFCGPDAVIVAWEDTSRMEIIENHNGKFYHQTSYSFGIGSNVEEVKKIGK